MPDQYLKVDDFLTWEAQLSRKLNHMSEDISAVKEQVNHLDTKLTAYIEETDKYRLETDKRLNTIEGTLTDIKQTIERGFSLIFARLGIQP